MRIALPLILVLSLFVTACNRPEEKASEQHISSNRETYACPNSQQISGKVVHVADGDTFTLRTNGGMEVHVRLAQIDAPENSQPWSRNSKHLLFNLLQNRPVCVSKIGTDRYNRTIAQVTAGRADVNLEMVKRGGAWAYRAYLTDSGYIAAETVAKNNRLGLWAMPETDRLAPWAYRKLPKESRPTASTSGLMRVENIVPAPQTNRNACAIVPQCKAIRNCAEAKRWLAFCGPEGLDGDGDGVPCEQKCK